MICATLLLSLAAVNSPDFNGDDFVNVKDLLTLVSGWGEPGLTDLDDDETTNVTDLLILLSAWGPVMPVYVKTPSSVISAAPGDIAWSNPGNATSDDGSDASVELNALDDETDDSENLWATTFGFALPDNAVIQGVKVGFDIQAFTNQFIFEDVRLIVGGALAGDDKAASTAVPTSFAVVNFGGESDLWGLSLSASQIEASTFGVALRVRRTAGSTFGNVLVDVVTITVYTSGGIYKSVAGEVFAPGARAGDVFHAGAGKGEVFVPGAMAGEVN